MAFSIVHLTIEKIKNTSPTIHLKEFYNDSLQNKQSIDKPKLNVNHENLI